MLSLGMGFLLAAVVLPLLGWLDRALTAAFGPIDGQIRYPFPRQRVPRHAPGLACGLHAQVGERLVQDGEQTVHPGVSLGLTQVKLSCMHGLERMRLLVDDNEQEFIRHARERTRGSASYTALSWLAFVCQLAGIALEVCGLKSGQQLQKFLQREAGRCEKIAGSVF
jgi:hypothetical protein